MQLKHVISRYRRRTEERRQEELRRTNTKIAALQPMEIRLRVHGTYPIEYGKVRSELTRLSRRAIVIEKRLGPLLRKREENAENEFMKAIVEGH